MSIDLRTFEFSIIYSVDVPEGVSIVSYKPPAASQFIYEAADYLDDCANRAVVVDIDDYDCLFSE